jgi:hypothetical protein
MRFAGLALFLPLACVLIRAAAGCDSSDSVASDIGDASYDGASFGSSTDADEPAVDAGAELPTLFRFAQLSAGLGPVDVCFRVGENDAFTGPIFGTAEAGFPNVTSYVTAPNATDFEVAVVDATTGSCSTPEARARITLAPGKKWTIAILGDFQAEIDAANALTIATFVDDDEVVSDASRSRFIHAALGGHQGKSYGPFSAAAQIGSLVPLAAEIDPKMVSTSSGAPPVVDALGYHTENITFDEGSLVLTEISDASTAAATWTSAPTSLALESGSVRTGFIVSDEAGIAVLWCNDNSDASDCHVIR